VKDPSQSPQRTGSTTNPKKPSLSEWLLLGGAFLLGVCLLFIYVYASLYGTTTEAELTFAEGVPTEVKLERLTGKGVTKDILEFTVAGRRTDYSSDKPKYPDILAAVKSRKPIRIWVATTQKALLPLSDRQQLYKVNVGDDSILTYSDVVEDEKSGQWAILLVGGFFFILGSLGVYSLFTQRRRYIAWTATLGAPGAASAQMPAKPEADSKRVPGDDRPGLPGG
jgi:hypothetical protein